mmetsp:Transcript_8861/g.32712  ORF Transcript_8861/g.32712 Transcript_8861/m.32712 type:complete len:367 (-) Transcript_8861:114-1214(-)
MTQPSIQPSSHTQSHHFIFGYGSLIWKNSFPYISKEWGYIQGFSRVFWQRSADHRGTLWNPGRVCTLKQESPENHKKPCWGMVFRISQEEYDDLIEKLDHREKGGYKKQYVDVFGENDELISDKALVYYGDGLETLEVEEPMEKTAAIIAYAQGPSGLNTEYLYNLVEMLRAKGFDEQGPDSYLFQLEKLTRNYEEEQRCYVGPDLKSDLARVDFAVRKIEETVDALMGHRVIYLSKNRVRTRMLVQRKHTQPSGIMHGGLNVVMGETACSMGAWLRCGPDEYAVGQEINCNHLKAIPVNQDIYVVCVAHPIHVGRSSQVWEFRIIRQDTGEIAAIGRMTASVRRTSKSSNSTQSELKLRGTKSKL